MSACVSDLKRALAAGRHLQREVHEGLEGSGFVLAAHALNCGFKLTLKQSHDDGLIQKLVFAPG